MKVEPPAVSVLVYGWQRVDVSRYPPIKESICDKETRKSLRAVVQGWDEEAGLARNPRIRRKARARSAGR